MSIWTFSCGPLPFQHDDLFFPNSVHISVASQVMCRTHQNPVNSFCPSSLQAVWCHDTQISCQRAVPSMCSQTPQGRDRQSLWCICSPSVHLGFFGTSWGLRNAKEEHHVLYMNWGKLARREHSLFISRQDFSQQVMSNFTVSHFFLLSFIPLSF